MWIADTSGCVNPSFQVGWRGRLISVGCRDHESGDLGFSDHSFGDAAKEDGCEGPMAMGADDDEIDGIFLDDFEHAVERAAFGNDPVNSMGIALDGGNSLVEPMFGAATGFGLECVHGGEFIRRESVCRVAGFGFHDMDDGEFGTEGFGHLACGFEDSGGGIGKVNGGEELFHNVTGLSCWMRQAKKE